MKLYLPDSTVARLMFCEAVFAMCILFFSMIQGSHTVDWALRELQLEFRVSLWIIIGRSCQKYHFFVTTSLLLSRQTNTSFVATKVCLSRQTRVCRDKPVFVATKHVFCRHKSMIVATKVLSRQTRVDKWYLWQLPPMTVDDCML